MAYYTEIERMESIKTIDDLIQAVTNTFQYWLDSHTKSKTWAEGWIIDDLQFTFTQCNGKLENNYFTFDWKEAALKRWCKAYKDWFVVCSHCEAIFEDGYEEECCEKPNYKPVSGIRLYGWESEIYYDAGDYFSLENFEDYAMEALVKDGFKVYKEALEGWIAEPVENVKHTLKMIKKAKTGADKLAAIAWAAHVRHVNGNVLSDYSGEVLDEYITSEQLLDLAAGGLNTFFSDEEIAKWLEEN